MDSVWAPTPLLHSGDQPILTPWYPIAHTYYSTPTMNTWSKKMFIQEQIATPPPDWLDHQYYLYTLPVQLCHRGQIGILDTNTTDYNLELY